MNNTKPQAATYMLLFNHAEMVVNVFTPSFIILQVDIGKKWKEVIDYNDKMVYSFHVCLFFFIAQNCALGTRRKHSMSAADSVLVSLKCRMTQEVRNQAEVDDTRCKAAHMMKTAAWKSGRVVVYWDSNRLS